MLQTGWTLCSLILLLRTTQTPEHYREHIRRRLCGGEKKAEGSGDLGAPRQTRGTCASFQFPPRLGPGDTGAVGTGLARTRRAPQRARYLVRGTGRGGPPRQRRLGDASATPGPSRMLLGTLLRAALVVSVRPSWTCGDRGPSNSPASKGRWGAYTSVVRRCMRHP